MSKVVFVDELPGDPRQRFPEFWAALIANPGRWAEYPGSVLSITNSAAQHSKNGVKFEAVQRAGKGYIRAVSA